MNTKLSFSSPADVDTECLAIVILDAAPAAVGAAGNAAKPDPRPQTSDRNVAAAAQELISAGEISGKCLEAVMVHRPQGVKAKRLLLMGGGQAQGFGSYELRRLAGAAVRCLKPKNIRALSFVAPPLASAADAVRAVVEGAIVGDFDPDIYKSDRKDQRVDELTVVAADPGAKPELEQALEVGRIIGESQNFTRELVNEPSNRLTPTVLGDRARQMAQETGLQCEVYGPEKLHELKMGAFWGVARGSDEPPRLIVLRYVPEGAPDQPVIGLVGKGITFDTGGISIKPSEGMEKMKYDMAGGAGMLGAMRAIALLQPQVKVIAVVCATENMPSGKAQKPGDIQIAMSGKAIEVINTDAEGRLVLADGLHYARQLGATCLLDAATLTGAVVVALGHVNVGVFANDDAMYRQFEQAAQRAGEKMWRMPLDAEYFEQIRSPIADIVNTGGRWGGAVTAAMFLKEFVDQTPWIHLDIAGTAWIDDHKPWMAKGPSGVTVRTIVEFIRDVAANPNAYSGRGSVPPQQAKTGLAGDPGGAPTPSSATQPRVDSGAGI